MVLASGRIGREGCGYATITGQGNGQGGREHGQKCDQLPGGRDIDKPEHRAHVAKVWGIEPDELPGPGVDAYEIFRRIDRGEVRGLLSICFNPKVSLPDNHFVGRMLDKLDFFVAIDFFLNETARHAEIVLPGSLQEEDEGTVTQIEGRVIKINKCVDSPGEARQDWRIIQDIARTLGRKKGFTFESPREIFEELRRASAGGIADYAGITYEKHRGRIRRLLALPPRRPPRHAAPVRGRLVEPDRSGQRAAFTSPTARRASSSLPIRRRRRTSIEDYPIILTTGRVVSQFLSGTQTRRIGPLVDQYPEPRIELHPRLASRLGVAEGDWTTVESRRGSCTLRAQVVTTIRPDTVFVPYHWAGARSINQVTIAAQDPISKIPEFKVCAVPHAQGGSAAGVCRSVRTATVIWRAGSRKRLQCRLEESNHRDTETQRRKDRINSLLFSLCLCVSVVSHFLQPLTHPRSPQKGNECRSPTSMASSSTPAVASAARLACRRAASATRTRDCR